jgi:putative transcriptional regulator
LENTLRIQRAVMRITQAELAEKVGVSRQAINSIETGKYVPSTILAIKLARVFNKTVEDIFHIGEGD